MIDKNEKEKKAVLNGLKFMAEIIAADIGFDIRVGDLTEAQMITLSEAVIDGYQNELLSSRQCPSCGRVAEDWSANRAAVKGRGRKDAEDRAALYRSWRWNWGNGLFVSDIDQVEWRLEGGEIKPVVALELTRLDGDIKPPQRYFDAIISRYKKRDGQASAITNFARRLGVDAIIVLFRHNLKDFWLYNLSSDEGWIYKDQDQYKNWLSSPSRGSV